MGGATCALSLLLAAGCDCSGSTLGADCTMDTDCDRMQFCDPTSMTCQMIPDPDSGPGDDGGGTDGGRIDAGDVDAVVCTDGDGDGVTDCAGDCDDADPLTYPGATEVCGDGVANDCSGGAADAGCMGIGTFVAEAPTGSDTNPGTQAMPVETIGQGIANAMTIGGGVDVFVATGTYPEDITMTEGISLHGGYEAAGWTRSPAANVATIQAQTAAGVAFPHGITNATSLDGFTVVGRNGVASSAAITLADNCAPVIENNVIRAGNASGNSAAININPMDLPNDTIAPLVQNNEIHLGGAGTGWGGGNGSWGIRSRRTALEARVNDISLAEARTVQRGIEIFNSPDATLLVGNRVRHPSGMSDVTFGIRVASSGATVTENDIHAGRCQNYCVGIAIEGNLTVVRVTNNIAIGGEGGATQSAGVTIAFEALPTTSPDVLIHSNFIDGGVGANAGRSVGLYLGERPSAPLSVGRIFNNVIRSGTGGSRYAIFEEHPNMDAQAIENNALYVDGSGSPTASALYHDEGATDLTDAAMVNGIAEATGNLVDDCSITNPVVDGDFHLMSGSMCIDAGVSTELPPVDYEGDTRPRGAAPDIGVDEV
jgi:hypothetical protein